MPDHCGDLTVLVKITLFGEKEEKVHFLIYAKSMGDMVKRALCALWGKEEKGAKDHAKKGHGAHGPHKAQRAPSRVFCL
jgi:hypothetical protein